MTSDTNPPHIAVIGAGLAGLTAAYRLQQQGLSVEVFEARNRAGGRVWTYTIGDSYDELGGKFFGDGGEATHLRAIVAEMGLQIESFTPVLTHRKIYDNGQIYDFDELIKDSPPASEENFQALTAKAKTARHIAEVLEWFFANHPILLRIYKQFLSNYEGSPSEILDTYCLDRFWEFYQYAHENEEPAETDFQLEWVRGGNSQLIEALCQKLQGPIHYDSPLERLTYSSGKVGVGIKSDPIHWFDRVILALPCSTFSAIQIDRGLIPHDQMEAISSLQYGSANKILIPIRLSGEAIPQFCTGSEFVVWFNADYSIMTIYFAGRAGILPPSDQRLQKYLAEIHAIHPNVELTGEPIWTNWTFDPYSKGSYSNYGINQYQTFNEKIEAFEEPVKKVFRPIDSKVFFAGEHATLIYHGTMEGAVESGERTARMVIRSFE